MKTFQVFIQGCVLSFCLLLSFSSFAASPPSMPALKIGDPAGGDLTGTYPNPTIRLGAVTASKLANGSVTFSKINAGSANAGQFLSTDGAGGLSWADAPGTDAIAVLAGASNGITSLDEDIAVIDQPPAGTYWVTAKLNVASGARTGVTCGLSEVSGNSSAFFDSAFVEIPDPFPGHFAAGANMSLSGFTKDPANIHLTCAVSSNDQPNATVGGAKLVAVRLNVSCSGTFCP